MKQLFLFLALTISISALAQAKKSTCKISKEQNNNGTTRSTAKLIVTFVGPTKKPVKSFVKMAVNNDTIFPKINDKGIYTADLEPGNYKLYFSVPFWYEVAIDKLKCAKNENINITVYFEAKEIGISH